jgi:hypothetical protein
MKQGSTLYEVLLQITKKVINQFPKNLHKKDLPAVAELELSRVLTPGHGWLGTSLSQVCLFESQSTKWLSSCLNLLLCYRMGERNEVRTSWL